jgi:hypothetical protein
MAKKIVEYNVVGDCSICDCVFEWETKDYTYHNCMAFNMDDINKYEQCQACKDFLTQEASKVYCDGCTHSVDYYRAHENGCGCELNSKTELDENGWYSLNCKSKERI